MDSVREGELHPLNNFHVLEHVFKSLNLQDLKCCRQVCRLWCESSTPAFRHLACVLISGNKNREMEKQWSQFLDFVTQEDTALPIAQFVNFKIFDLPSKDYVPTVFWELYGNNIKFLELSNISFESVDDFRHIIFQCCPNQENLTLGSIDLNTNEKSNEPEGWIPPRFPPNRKLKSLLITSWKCFGISFMEILSHFPSLEDLRVYCTMFVKIDGLFTSLNSCWSHVPHSWPIKRFGFSVDSVVDPFAIFPVFMNESFSLEELIFEDYFCLGRIRGHQIIQEILPYTKSLKRLEFRKIHPEMSSFGNFFLLPVNAILDTIEELKIKGANLYPLSFLKCVPNLKKLELYGFENQLDYSMMQMTDQDWVLEYCTELALGHDEEWNKRLKSAALEKLLRRLPNLRKLEMRPCDNEMFPVICELLPKFEYLDLKRCKIDDSAISGLDSEDMARINSEEENGSRKLFTVSRPNLSSLKNLKWLSLERDPNAETELGLSTAKMGIEQLPMLEHLCMTGYSLPIFHRLCAQYPWKNL